MKKVLVAGAALMLAGSIVPVASAGNSGGASGDATGLSISGDARVTYVGMTDYGRLGVINRDNGFGISNDIENGNGYSDYFESRVGVNLDARTMGGVSVHARLYFDDKGYNDDVVWNGSGNAQWGVSTDYAYFKVPLSDTMTLRAGRIPLNFTKFYSWDIRPTRVQLIYKSGNLKLVPFVGVVSEDSNDPLDNWDDNDFMQYGIVPVLKLNDAWTLKAFLRWNDDARELTANDRSGFDGTVNLTGTIGNVGLTAEASYMSADFQMKEDDGIGGYVQAAFKMPGLTPVVLAGMTQGGFMANQNFGFVMVGGNESTTVVNVGNPIGDLMFGALVFMHDISDRLSAQGNLLYASYDYDNDVAAQGQLDSAIEVSGVFNYALSDNTSFEYKLGYLAPTFNDGAADVAEDAYIGHVLRMNVEF
ncbi:hypothetical protein VU04_00595 [Desulfobulbus sp. TB]|nr:hypothetical protein [Desulfobulbus sp. TB]